MTRLHLRLACLILTATLLAGNHSSAEDLKKIAASIDGYRYEFPCKDPMPENPKPGADGDSARATNDKLTDIKNSGLLNRY